MRLDLIEEFRLDLHPYVAGEGTRRRRSPDVLNIQVGGLPPNRGRDRLPVE